MDKLSGHLMAMFMVGGIMFKLGYSEHWPITQIPAEAFRGVAYIFAVLTGSGELAYLISFGLFAGLYWVVYKISELLVGGTIDHFKRANSTDSQGEASSDPWRKP